MSIDTTQGRWQKLKRQATTAQLFDVNVEVLNIDQIKKIYVDLSNKYQSSKEESSIPLK